MVTFELCCANIRSVQLAADLNIEAIELCVDLKHGGLTPSIGLIHKAREIFKGELAVFFRLRNGDFIYDQLEKEVMLRDIAISVSAGVNTIVAGGMKQDGSLDEDFMDRIIEAANGKTVSYHRAIDICPNAEEIIEQLIGKKVKRLLSSGRQTNAFLGVGQLNSWIEQYGADIEVMAGGGLRLENTPQFLKKFKGHRFHASLRLDEIPDDSLLMLGKKEEAERKQLLNMLEIIKKHD